MTKWAEIFSPVSNSGGRVIEPRREQEILGQGIIDAFHNRVNLIAEAKTGSGKSFAYLVPLINKIKNAPKGVMIRGAVSTETTALQDQLALKDLPFLHGIYGGFTYRVLKGRSNYLCFNALEVSARGNAMSAKYLTILEKQTSRIGDGERRDIERVLGVDLDDASWAFLAGSPIGCGESDCKIKKCYSARARALAAQANIVVVNHALLRVDAETIASGEAELQENFLGPLDFLVVDEAHTLEAVLMSGWTQELSEWEITDKNAKLLSGVDAAKSVISNDSVGYLAQQATEGLEGFIKSVTRFYSLIHKDTDWDRVTDAICLKTVMGSADSDIARAMFAYEVDGPVALESALANFEQIQEYLKKVIEKAVEQEIKGLRPLRKAMRALLDLRLIVKRILAAMETKDGILMEYGTPYGVVLNGYYRRDGRATVRLSVVPLDVSGLAEPIWAHRTCVLVSATLTDLTDGSFRYIGASLGLPNYQEVRTGSPFDYAQQQIVYVTPATGEVVDVKGAKYCFEEMVDLVRAADGRSLVLFTARGELDDAAYRLRQLAATGEFNWPILVQDKESNKQRLVDQFRSEKHSVLLATKSFFTGVDFPGDTCSLVVICKFPLPQFNVICKMQIAWWRRRGFNEWYEKEALTVWQQAAGRLIRAGSDRGAVALLDQRVTIASERVAKTARRGVESLGSGVTRSINDVRTFLL